MRFAIISQPKLRQLVMGAVLFGGVGAAAMPAFAQDEEARIRKLEAEVRAMQRVVFPGGDGRFFTPEVTAGQPATPSQTIGPVTPSTTAVTDILARLDALETQIARLTARTEESDNTLRQFGVRLETLETARTSGSVPPLNAPVDESDIGDVAAPVSVPVTARPAPVTSQPVATVAAAPTPERLAAVQAITKPATGDAGDDEYTYGFRLWDAGLFPEAQQQLRMFVDQYPNHLRTTFGRNLLGRAFLDNGQASQAAPWFLQNYNADKGSARAPDSLLYLAETMIAMDDDRRACIALAEFGETYPALATGRLESQYDGNRGRVSCN